MSCRRVFLLVVTCACGLELAAADAEFVAAAKDWRALVGNSPFDADGRPSAAPPPAGSPEFRGLVQEAGEIWVNLYFPDTRRAVWSPVPGPADQQLRVEAYDPVAEKLIVRFAGRQLELLLQHGRVRLPKDIAPLIITDKPVTTEPGEDDRTAFLKQLPPEARRLLEQVTRRRMVQGEPSPAGVPPPEAARR